MDLKIKNKNSVSGEKIYTERTLIGIMDHLGNFGTVIFYNDVFRENIQSIEDIESFFSITSVLEWSEKP